MPDSFDNNLEQLLAYRKMPDDETFVMDVMRAVRREQGARRLILWVFGLVGAIFGLVGATMLAGPVGSLLSFSDDLIFPVTKTVQLALFTAGAAAFYLWFMNDDLSLGD